MSQSHMSHTYNIDGGKEAKIRKQKVESFHKWDINFRVE